MRLRPELTFGGPHDGVVINRTGRRQHHPLRGVFAGHEGADHAAVEGADGLRPAEDRAPDRLARKRRLYEGVVNEVVGVSSTAAYSCKMTFFSRANSASSKTELVRMSPSTSRARSTFSPSTRAV